MDLVPVGGGCHGQDNDGDGEAVCETAYVLVLPEGRYDESDEAGHAGDGAKEVESQPPKWSRVMLRFRFWSFRD